MSEPNREHDHDEELDDELEDSDENEPVLVTLQDEDGEERTFQLLHVLEVDNRSYGVLVALDDEEPSANGSGAADDGEEDEGDLIILRMVQDGDEEYFEEIESDDEFRKVVTVLEQLVESDELVFDAAAHAE